MVKNIFRSKFDGFEEVSDELIKFSEERLGKKLPNSYKELLQTQNGGYLTKSAFPTEVNNHSADGYIPVELIHGISRDPDNIYGVLTTEYMTEEWELPNGLVLLCGDGHTWIALDYRGDLEEPKVVFLDVEMEQEIELSQDFGSFIEGLIDEPDC